MQPGLEGVVAAETVLSTADPDRGQLWMRGVPVPQLVDQYGFEGTIALLWDGFAADGPPRATIAAELGAARAAAFAMISERLGGDSGQPIEALLCDFMAQLPDTSTAVDIIGALSVAVPALIRTRRHAAPLPPDPSASTAEDLLRMAHGTTPEPARVAALDTYYTVMMESGLSASSFTARIVASTRAPLTAAVLAAWCAFTGPLHGGAPGPTLDLLEEAARQPDLDAWLERKLRAGERLMGFGHRLFPDGNDPRAEAIRGALRRLGPDASRLAFATELERHVQAVLGRVKPGRALPANVEIAAALLLDALGFPRAAFTAVFAVGRAPGWIAHALEQRKTGRMYRPTAAYVGPAVVA
jgi:citrate synthase